MEYSTKHFPNNFLWGASSSSAQVEGGYDCDDKGLTIWDVKKLNPGTCSFHYASDFYHHYSAYSNYFSL